MRIVVDCAHGAGYKVAPTVFWELGAEVFSLGVSPDGLNINRECGALSPEQMRREVLARRADIGIALDGDADRLIIADERGVILDGDQLMALIATGLARGGRLTGSALVATIMSNLGLERFLAGHSIELHRTKVGDRHVVEKMRALGCNLGGEQSGHIILSDYATTGDGLIAALQVLASIVETGRRASEVCRLFTPVPQRLRSVRFAEGDPLASIRVKRAIDDGKDRLGAAGRLVIRKSGTEPMIRVMAEGEDEELVAAIVDEICDAIRDAVAGIEDNRPRIASLGSAQAAE
jgi:phosphoglucosamine mutase